MAQMKAVMDAGDHASLLAGGGWDLRGVLSAEASRAQKTPGGLSPKVFGHGLNQSTAFWAEL